jgi:cellulose synthase/poly-beta-1,6-N-acetylglucosamine synthase-like glycosyltransferase
LLATIVAGIYLVASVLVATYALSQAHLLWTWLRHPVPGERALPADDALPIVTLQLPFFNERAVAPRLMRAVAALDWPRDKLQLQVLDDSLDDTVQRVDQAAEELRAQGVWVDVVRRTERTGYKAGALAHGLETAAGAFVGVFDADFIPEGDFLRRTMPWFLGEDAERRALVQARWGWINDRHSLLTRVQALQLDAHFTMEQHARSHSGLLMSFNGTAGIWRRAAIDDAGGWSDDTLVEDLDLSYRAQLKGWELFYLDGVEAPSELPAEMGAIRTQQHRWMKGGAQVARKLLPTVWRSSLPLRRKLQGTAHLVSSSVYLAVLTLCLVGPGIVLLDGAFSEPAKVTLLVSGVLLAQSLVILFGFYVATAVRRGGVGGGLLRLAWGFPAFLSLSAGMSVHDSLAVVEGWMGRKSPFVRTPKIGDEGEAYIRRRAPITVWIELAVAAWGLLGAWVALGSPQPMRALFLVAQAAGFATIAAVSLWHARPRPAPGSVAAQSVSR